MISLFILAAISLSWSQGAQPSESHPCAQLLSAESFLSEPERIDLQAARIQQLQVAVKERLGIHHDPFSLASSAEKGLEIWRSLLSSFPSLAEVRDAVDSALREHADVDARFEQRVLQEVETLLGRPSSSKLALAGAAEALRKLMLIHERNQPSQTTEDEKDKKKEEDQKQQKQQPQQQTPPQIKFPKMPKHYQAHNKDTDSEGQSQAQISVASVDKAGVRYFRLRTYQLVDSVRNSISSIDISQPPTRSLTQTSLHTLKVKPLDQAGAELDLPVPVGFTPITFHGDQGYVKRDSTGNYIFNTSQEELEIALLPRGVAARPLSPAENDAYTAHTGSTFSDWPEHLQQAVLNLKTLRAEGKFSGSAANVEIGQTLALYIAKHFKYRVDADPIASTSALAKNGAFQCDTAAVIWTAILRDEFKIPCRVVSGYRGASKKNDPHQSHLVLPSEAHAWGEVADENGDWWEADPTPYEKDRKTEEQDSSSEFQSIADENAEQKPDGETGSESKADAGESGSEKSLAELIEEMKKMQAEKREERAKESKAPSESEGTEDPFGQTGEHASAQAIRAESMLRQLEERNPLVQRLIMRTALWAIDPALPSKVKTQRLNNLKSLIGSDTGGIFPSLDRFKAVLAETTLLFNKNRPSFELWAEKILKDAPVKPLNATSDELMALKQQIEGTLRFMDPAPGSKESLPLLSLLSSIARLQEALGKIRHPDSEAIRVATEMFEGLPGNISRQVIRERFGLEGAPKDDLATLNLAKEISQGTLNDFRLASILGPFTEFVVEPIAVPSQGSLLTWEPAVRRQKGRYQVLMTGDPRQRQRAVRIHQQLSDEEAFARGEMGVLVQRKKVRVPEGFEHSEPEKATVIPFDCSGSMSGNNAYFQTAFIGALVDRALSDPHGRHRVYLIPFTEQVFPAVEVRTVKEAQDLIRNLHAKTQNLNGGTDIQKALIAAADVLKGANQTGDKALARATVVLLSDGGSEVNASAVRQAFKEASGKAKVLMAFVGIGGTNPALVELAEGSHKLGADAGMYLEWNSEDIHRVLTESKQPAKAKNAFWTNVSYDGATSELRRSFADFARDMARYRSANSLSGSSLALPVATQKLQQQVNATAIQRKQKREKNHLARFRGFRRALNMLGGGFTSVERQRILEEVLSVWNQVIPESLRELAHDEVAEIFHFFSWPETGVSGSREAKDER